MKGVFGLRKANRAALPAAERPDPEGAGRDVLEAFGRQASPRRYLTMPEKSMSAWPELQNMA